MSKVGEYFIEMQELGLIQSPEPTEEEYNLVEEPTDDELSEIIIKVITARWVDLVQL